MFGTQLNQGEDFPRRALEGMRQEIGGMKLITLLNQQEVEEDL